MKRGIFLLTVGLFLILSQSVFASQPPSESVLQNPSLTLEKANTEAKVRLSKNYGNLPLAFEANEGQTDVQVKFLSRGSGYSLFLTPTETVLSLSKDDQSTAIRMGLVGANPKPKMTGEEKLPGKSNYFLGNDPKKWRTNISTYQKVRYEEIYPGIDLVYYGYQRKLEYDFIVKPGVDPKAIRMQFAGVERMSVEAGDLILHTDSGEVVQKAPIIYQEIDGKRKKVAGNYMFLAANQVGFYLGEFDKSQPLVIDPFIEYATYLGGNEDDIPRGVVVDTDGHAYIAGTTESLNFPTSSGVIDSIKTAMDRDAFITKLNPAGTELVFSTFLGGGQWDEGTDIAINDSGIYITGFTRSSRLTAPLVDFPITAGAFQTVSTDLGQPADAFVTKLNLSGSALLYSTLLGGDYQDGFRRGNTIAVDNAGYAYITGITNSENFPTVNAFQSEPGKVEIVHPDHGGISLDWDVFLTKLNLDGTGLVYSTYLHSESEETEAPEGEGLRDIPLDVAVDAFGNAYVTGWTESVNFPTTSGAFQTTFGGGDSDLFVTKFDSTGVLEYSTYLGGGGHETNTINPRGVGGIALDSSGNAYIVGYAKWTDFPTTEGAYHYWGDFAPGPWGNGTQAFVAKLNSEGSDLVYSTGLHTVGGRAQITDISVDADGNAYVSGTGQIRLVDPFNTLDNSMSNSGIFVAKLNPTGSTLLYSSLISKREPAPTTQSTVSTGGALDVSGNLYVIGTTNRALYPPVTPGAYQGVYGGGSRDGFIAKINPASAPEVTADAGPDQTVDEGVAVNLDGTGSTPAGPDLNFEWMQVAGPTVSLTGANSATPSFDAPYVSGNTTLTFELIVDDGTNYSDPADSVDIVVVSVNNPPVADAGDDGTIKPGAIATLDGSNSFDPESDPTITYRWTQVSGAPVVLSDATAEQPTFTAPNAVGDVLVFKLQVSDGNESSTPSAGTDSAQADTVAVTIVANSQPVADAGPDQTKDEGSLVTHDGTGSFDSDGGDTISFQWAQTGGPAVTMSSTTTSSPTFTAPAVGPGGEDFTFSMVVTDDDPVNPLSSLPSEVTIHVANINDPPSCNLAVAKPKNLWPPNHKMKSVNIDGVMDSDAEFNDVTLQITTVTQDEPVNGTGDGDTSPDAVIQVSDPADSVLIRAERSGGGNGRVYQINFTASDGFESCNGSVQVTVPKSRKSGAVDDGQNFDSTLP